MPKRILPTTKILVVDYQSGLSTSQIAVKYGAKNGSVVHRHLKLSGIQMRTSEESNKILRDQGLIKPARYWLGKKQSPAMVESRVSKIRGENHYLWKGGNSKRNYRNVIEKTECAECFTKEDLGIHHLDFDHFNDEPSNLRVLCNSCHISLHKREYWRCKREGVEYKSNAPIGWE